MIISQENKDDLARCNQCYMVGRLAKNESYYPSGVEQKEVTTMKNSQSVIFYIKPLSMDPEPIVNLMPSNLSDSPLYIGRDFDQGDWFMSLKYKYNEDEEQKKKMMYEKLNNKLIIYKPKMSFQSKEGIEKAFKNAIVINVEPDINCDDDVEFIPVPIVEMSNNEFEKKMIEGSSVILKGYSHQMLTPDYIMCNNYIYVNLPELNKTPKNNEWVFEHYDNRTKRVKINIENGDMDGKIIEVGGVNIIFIERGTLSALERNGKLEDLSEPIKERTIPKDNIESEDTSKTEINIRESNFINAFKELTLANNLCYSKEDLINLHTCVKTNPLTILAGMSGTGKSELANFYAKMLKATDGHNLLFLPISPSFTEPGDILGFLNNTTGLFIPSETGLSEFLIQAKSNPNLMHIVIFDEMNLSQVEYWFSPFISLLERNEDNRILNLYNSASHCVNKQSFPPSIRIGENVKFIGTVNMDETTKDFSDRLLDRANIINLKKEKISKLKIEVEEINTYFDYEKCKCTDYEEYKSWTVQEKWTEAYIENEIKFLDDLHELINKLDEQKGVSFRIVRKIGEYLLNIPVNPDGTTMISKREAFDLQIKQRLITKIKGTEKKYGKLIGTIKDNESEIPLNSELYEFFNSDEALGISDFELTKKEIAKKAKELGVYGYAN